MLENISTIEWRRLLLAAALLINLIFMILFFIEHKDTFTKRSRRTILFLIVIFMIINIAFDLLMYFTD